MSMIGNLIRVSQPELDSFLKQPGLLEAIIFEEKYKPEKHLDIGKSWEAIHFILTGNVFEDSKEEPGILERVLFSFQVIDKDQDLGYGPAHYLISEQVIETAEALNNLTEEDIANKYDGRKMDEKGVYPQGWELPENFDYLIEELKILDDFYQVAAFSNEAVIFFLD